jgi:hypothetical protein
MMKGRKRSLAAQIAGHADAGGRGVCIYKIRNKIKI